MDSFKSTSSHEHRPELPRVDHLGKRLKKGSNELPCARTQSNCAQRHWVSECAFEGMWMYLWQKSVGVG